jgi:hypothetical protein
MYYQHHPNIIIYRFYGGTKLKGCNKFGQEWSQLSVTKHLRKVVNRITIDNDKHVYDLAEEVFKEKFPNYFENV